MKRGSFEFNEKRIFVIFLQFRCSVLRCSPMATQIPDSDMALGAGIPLLIKSFFFSYQNEWKQNGEKHYQNYFADEVFPWEN